MKNLFVSYETAKQLKNKGFNEPCLAIYQETNYLLLGECRGYNMSHDIYAPLYQQAISFLLNLYDKINENQELLSIELFGDNSGNIRQKDENIFDFENLEECIEELLIKLN